MNTQMLLNYRLAAEKKRDLEAGAEHRHLVRQARAGRSSRGMFLADAAAPIRAALARAAGFGSRPQAPAAANAADRTLPTTG